MSLTTKKYDDYALFRYHSLTVIFGWKMMQFCTDWLFNLKYWSVKVIWFVYKSCWEAVYKEEVVIRLGVFRVKLVFFSL